MNYPDLKNSNIIAFDIETYDPELIEKGTGVYRKDGKILGVSISNGEFTEYYNIGHKDCKKEEKEKNLNYLKTVLSTNIPKVAANILYDYDWLVNGYGFNINGKLHDIQMAEPLICEYKNSYSLDNLAKEYLHIGKEKTLIDKFCEDHNLKGDSRKHLYLMPYATVKPYAKKDSELLIPIINKQLLKLKEENLLELYNMEIGLIPLIMQMRKVGVRIDVDKTNQKINYLLNSIKESKALLTKKYGDFNVKSGKQIAKIFDRLNIPYERGQPTALMIHNGHTVGNPILDKNALKNIDHEICHNILKIREYRTILKTFFINSFTDCRVGERVHTNFNPLKSDTYGTISGRFSSNKPNLQQIPGKEETMGEFCREVFLPEESMVWARLDWSQIEYRIIAHYASGEKSDAIRKEYNTNPKTDYHQMIMDWTGLDRKTAKMLNFGMAYFMGTFTCSKKFGWTMEEAQQFIDTYHKEVPFVKTTRNHVVKIAKIRGYLKTVLNRRARISPRMIESHKEYSIFNRLIQGSAADIMKKAMYDSYQKGLFNVLIPHLTVHDELDVSVPKTKEGIEALKELKNTMETCVQLKVPITAELEIGKNWADANELKALKFLKGELL